MTLYKELANDHDISTIKGIKFYVMSPKDIVSNSVVEITKSDTFEKNEPTPNGLFDPRMGVIEHGKTCITCEQKNNFCPGHFGHIVLSKPMFYIQFFGMVRNLLKCVCFRCSKILIDTTTEEFKAIAEKKMSRQKRWEVMFEILGKNKKCIGPDGCGAKQPTTIQKEGILKLVMDWKDDEIEKQVLLAEDVLKIFKRISDKDAQLLGFGKGMRPEHLICTVLPVPPPAVRPSVRNDAGQRSEDDLTHKLSMIVKHNNKLAHVMEKNNKDQVDMHIMLLQYEIATLIDNTAPGIPPSQQRTGRAMKSVSQRLKGKEGRIRGNLMGKRVDFSGRSVITGDPNISIDELGVPIKIAMNMTFPEVVNPYNMEDMVKLVLNGPEKYPGAKFVRKVHEKRTIRLKDIDRNEVANDLKVGDIIERHMKDGDYVLFNRQPSLHRSSMMGHKAKIMPHNTFRLNVSVTQCFNADFDGDEMNAHLPQSYKTHEELLQLAAVPYQIIGPRECKPIVSIVQDIVLGLYRMTKSDVRMSLKQFMNLMVTNPKCTGEVPSYKDMLTGHQILSTIMPSKINIRRGNGQYDEANPNPEHFVKIENGKVISGCFDKDIYQSRTFGIVHSIFNEYGPEATKDFFDNTQRLICNWLVYNGFSVGISDLIVSDDTIKSFSTTINEMKGQVYNTIEDIHKKAYVQESTKNKYEDFEKRVNDLLNEAVNRVGKAVAEQINDKSNRMINMIKSKAKGNTINVSQMIGCIGQQNVDGRRIPYGYDDRTLPHYTRYDDGPESRGFVENSFINGLNPQEFFFAAMGGREGLIDTAVNTSHSGYIQRKLNKAMEDCRVYDDRSVRTNNGSIIQFSYGDDGMDACKVESQPIPYIHEDIDSKYGFGLKELKKALTTSAYEEAKASKAKWSKRLEEHLEQLKADKDYIITKIFNCKVETSLMYPVSIARTLNITDGIYGGKVCDLTPDYIFDKIEAICEELYISKMHPGNRLFHMLIRCYLSPSKIIFKHKYCKEAFDYVIDQIRIKYFDSLAHPGEMVGVIAAQSIGEPATQMTLNSVEWNTEILIKNKYGGFERHKIGELIDGIVMNASEKHVENHPNNTTLVWTKHEDMYVLSCDEMGKVTWKQVEAVTKHPPINEDGSNTLLKVTTASGRTVTATKAKSFLKRVHNKIIPVRGDDLVVGDYVPVSNVLPDNGKDVWELDLEMNYELGRMFASYIKSGYCVDDVVHIEASDSVVHICDQYNLRYTLEKNMAIIYSPALAHHFKTKVIDRRIPPDVLKAPKAFLKGIVEFGYLHGEDMYAIETCIGKTGDVIPDVETMHHGILSLTPVELEKYVSIAQNEDLEVIKRALYDEDIVYDKIVSIEECSSKHPHVYDLTVQDTRNFNIYNGLAIRDTFHFAGVSDASKSVRGIPRLQELLSVSKKIKTPVMRIHFKDHIKNDYNMCSDIMHDICIVRFKDIIDASQIVFDPNDNLKDDVDFMKIHKEFETDQCVVSSPWLLRITFNKAAVHKYHLSMSDIHQKLVEYYRDDTITCFFSDINAEHLVFRIKLKGDTNDVLTELKALEYNILEKITIKGVENIEKVSITKKNMLMYNPITQENTMNDEWLVFTEGTNLAALLAHPLIDTDKLYSNNVKEVFEVLGIEAARQALYIEIQEVLESITVNYKHISLLIDVQTNKGTLLSIDRHGINRGDIGPLAKCSFEETTDKLIKAGIFGEQDRLNGVSANVMLGQIVPSGTGVIDLIIDESKLPDIDEEEEDGEFSEEDDNPECAEEMFQINFEQPPIQRNKVLA